MGVTIDAPVPQCSECGALIGHTYAEDYSKLSVEPHLCEDAPGGDA